MNLAIATRSVSMSATPKPATIGQRIRAAYLRRGYNRTSFSKAIDVHYTNIAAWERGDQQPSRANVSLAAEILNIPEAELYGYTEPTKSYAAFDEWLETGEGQHAPEDIRSIMASQRWAREPTVLNFHYLYHALTYGLPASRAVEASEATRAERETGKRAGGRPKRLGRHDDDQ
jgi:transcriptional regulator with XRE-family HTH domain